MWVNNHERTLPSHYTKCPKATAGNTMSTPRQKQYASAILNDLSQVNPYTKKDGMIAYLYAAGYLAGFLASLAEEDPWIYKRFKKHIEDSQST